jgi:Ca2+-binding RTX toxin-like protein
MPSTLTGLNPSVSFAENVVNVAPQLLDVNVAFSATGSLAGSRLVVSGLLAEDRVSVLHQGGGAGEVGVSGSTVSYGGVVIGTAMGGVGSNLTITFNSAVTAAAVDAVIERLAYGNVSNTPGQSRTLSFNFIDAAGALVNAPLAPTFVELVGNNNPFNSIDVGENSAPTFADIDGDGDFDLLLGSYEGTLRLWRNTGSSFVEQTGAANPFGGINGVLSSAPVFADFDGDGDRDLVVCLDGRSLRAWRNNAGSFVELTGSSNPFSAVSLFTERPVSFVDFDRDGDLDLVAGNSISFSPLQVWRNNGSSFSAVTGAANPFATLDDGDDPAPVFADLDGDGDLDLILGTYGSLRVWRNDGANYTALVDAANPLAAFVFGDYAAPSFVDLDGDGRLDLVVGEYDGTLNVFRNTTTLPSITVTVKAEDDLTDGNDIINASPLDDTVDGLAGDDRIDGLAGNDSLLGMSGSDTLTGGAGSDTLMGGTGNDLFIISDTLDVIIETAGGGTDTIITSVSMTMPDHIEALRIATDVSGLTITGGAGNDLLIGNGVANNFNGGAGDDVILAGNVTLADIYALFAT